LTILLFDLSGQPHILLAVLRALHREPGTVVHLLAEHPLQPVRFSRHGASYTTVTSASREESIVGQIERLIGQRGIDVILPSGVAATRFLSKYRRVLQELCAIAPVPDLAALELARDKGRLSTHMQSSGIPHPRTIVVREPSEAIGFFDSLGGPALMKPLLSAGGRGFIRFDRREILERWSQGTEAPEDYLLQEFIPGHDIDCSVLSHHGTILAHTVQRGTQGGIRSYAAPAAVEFIDHQGAFEIASMLAGSLRWSGVAHIDMRYDERDGTVKVLELNPRYWRSLLGSTTVGVNFPYLACLYALRGRFDPPASSPGRYVHETRAALRQMLRQRGRKHPYRFTETVLGESSRDPLPELALLLFHRLLPQAREG